MSYYWFLVITLILLTAISGFYASSETAYFSLPVARIQLWRKSSDRKRRMVAELLTHSRRLLVLIFILNTIINVLIQNAASDLFDHIGRGWALKVGVPFAIILIFGEFLPKYLGRINSESLALFAAPFYTSMTRYTAPLQKKITHIAEMLARLFFFFLKPEPPLSPKEMQGVIETCEMHNVLSADESLLLRQVLDFEHKNARELMIPRSEITTIKRSQLSFDLAASLMHSATGQELVLVDEEIDRPLGAIDNQTLLFLQIGEIKKALAISSEKLFFVPETMSSRKLLEEFVVRQSDIACVIDEHGTISGFVVWSDFSKKLALPQSPIEKTPLWKQQSITVSGTMSLETINTYFDTHLSSQYHSATIGGWLTEMLDEIPAPGATYVTPTLIFRILSADNTMIEQIFIQKRDKKDRK